MSGGVVRTGSHTELGRLAGGQVPALVRLAKEAVEAGRCCVIGLQSTGESRTADVIAERGEELDDFVSGPRVGADAGATRWCLCSAEGGGACLLLLTGLGR